MARRTPLVCPTCARALTADSTEMSCAGEHRFATVDSITDLAPGAGDESTASTFDTWYGAFYDAGVRRPRLASGVARGIWGANLRTMYRLMRRGAEGAA